MRPTQLKFVLVAAALCACGCNGGLDLPGSDNGVPGFVVRLSVSNLSPQLNEEVQLRCSIVQGQAGTATFDFQPGNGRLFINRAAGTAIFLVEESDLGTAFSFTCTASNDNGMSAPSAPITFIPTG